MLAVAAIYFGKPVLVPLTLAILLTFLLNPVVNLVERTGLPRAAAVLVVVISVFSLLGIVAYAMGRQVTMLAAELPQYKITLSARSPTSAPPAIAARWSDSRARFTTSSAKSSVRTARRSKRASMPLVASW